MENTSQQPNATGGPLRRTYTPEEFFEVMGLGRSAGYEALRRGEIPGAFKIGQKWFIPRSTADRLLQQA